MNFKDKVDSFMKQNNISNLKQFALQANIPYTTLRDVFNKQDMSNFRISTISKLSTYMNCSIEYLLSDNEKVMNKNKIELKVDENGICKKFNIDGKTFGKNISKLEIIVEASKKTKLIMEYMGECDIEIESTEIKKQINNIKE